jgi:hypothetical protein
MDDRGGGGNRLHAPPHSLGDRPWGLAEQGTTIDEWINLDEYDRACALAVRLATMR